jgi:hypothetical protein
MRNRLVCIATMVAVLLSAGSAFAQPEYSFETIFPAGGPPGPDGFHGAGATVTQDTIGTTHGLHSMKYDVGAGGFVGARTEFVPPTVNNPPGVQYVLFDMYVPATFGGTFAVIGISGFGHDLDNASFGNPFQFADELPIPTTVGQHNDLRIDLDLDVHSGQSFNDRFGDDTNDLDVVSLFQFFINKTPSAPITVYIDNVRFVVPEPATFSLMGLGAVVIGAMARRRRS